MIRTNGLIKEVGLINQLVRRDIKNRYQGSALGRLWMLATPLLQMVIYTFVFSIVFQMRWGEGQQDIGLFALNIMVGMVVFSFFSECVNRATVVVREHSSYVKKVIFPLEVLPITVVLTSLFSLLIGFFVFFVGYGVVVNYFSFKFLLLIPLFFSLVLLTVGVSWFVASLGVFVRDLQHLVGTMTAMLMFMTPVFYPMSMVPVKYQDILSINPLVYYVEQTRGILFHGNSLDLISFGINLLVSIVAAYFGHKWFSKTQKAFSDVV